MEDFTELIDELSDKRGPLISDIKFVVSQFNEPILIKGEGLEWLVDDMIGSAYLRDILDTKEMEKLPTEFGLYSAKLHAHSFRSNHPEDPEEWDMNIWLEETKLEIKL